MLSNFSINIKLIIHGVNKFIIFHEYVESLDVNIDQEIVFVLTLVIITSNTYVIPKINYQFVWYIHHSGREK